MVSSVLLCFRPLLPGGQAFCALSAHACAFYSFLSQELKQLERSLEERPISLRWLAEAMILLKRMHIELLALFKNCKLPIAFTAEDDWFNQYMQETTTLLDLCNSLKSAVSVIHRYRMEIDLVVEKIAQGNPPRTIFLDDVETKHVETVRVDLAIEFQGSNNNKTEKSIIASVMLAAKFTVIVVSVLLISALVSTPFSIDVGSKELTSNFPQLEPFVEILSALVARFHENGSKLVLAEHEMVDVTIGVLKAQAMRVADDGGDEKEEFMKSAHLLRTSSDQLKEGIEMFDAVVDQVFEVVMKGRNEMLGVLREGVLSVG